MSIIKNRQYYKFCFYGFLKNLRFFEAFFILFLRDAGLSFTAIGSLYAIREITTNLMEMPTGVIADTYGRKTALIGSFAAYIISFVVFYTAHGFAWFVPAFVLYGVGEAFRSGTHKAMIMDYLHMQGQSNKKVTYYGHTRSCSQKGSAVSALLAGLFVYFGGNYRSVFMFSILPYLINMILVASYPGGLNKSSSLSEVKRTGIRETLRSLFKALRRPKVFTIINDSALHTAYLKAIKDYIQPLMVQISLLIPLAFVSDEKKKEALVIGLIYTLIYYFSSQASRHSGILDSKSRQKVNYTTLLLGLTLGLGTGLFYQYQYMIPALVTFALIYLVENFRKPVMTGYIAENVPNEILASVLSAQSLIKTLMTSSIALLFGILADQSGIGLAFIFMSGGLILVVIAINKFLY